MDGIYNKRERIKEIIRTTLNVLFFPFAVGDMLFDFLKFAEDKIRRKSKR
ncbi:hypothetical protein [Sulfolobus acidocaldarius]|nr:hypothetical protein [Sulfolobus acidocaldarius]